MDSLSLESSSGMLLSSTVPTLFEAGELFSAFTTPKCTGREEGYS
jgi:hypothetical protein